MTAPQLPNRPYARLTNEELAELKAYYERWNDAEAISINFARFRLAEIAAELAHRQES